MSSGLAVALIIIIGGLAALLSAAVIAYSVVRSRFVSRGLKGEIGKLKKALKGPAVYLDGLQATNERRKNVILYSALRLYRDKKYGKAAPALEDALLLAANDNERCSVLNLAGLCRVKDGAAGDAEKTFLEMTATAQRAELDEALAPALGNIGNIYFTLGELAKALEFLQKALKIDEEKGRLEGEAWNLGSIGRVYFALAEQKKVFDYYKKALEHYQKALKIDEKTGCLKGQARELGNIGAYFLAFGDLQKGLEYYGKALDLSVKINDLRLQARHLDALGIIHKTQDNPAEAIRCYEKALKIAESIGTPGTRAGTLANIGALWVQMGDNKFALEHFQKALDIYTRIRAKDKIAFCEGSMARIRQKLAEQ